jgi:hypothetical protein
MTIRATITDSTAGIVTALAAAAAARAAAPAANSDTPKRSPAECGGPRDAGMRALSAKMFLV